MVDSLVKCRSALFNPGGCYKKTLGGGQPPGLKSADRAKRCIYLTASRQATGHQYNVGFDANLGVSDASSTPNNIITA